MPTVVIGSPPRASGSRYRPTRSYSAPTIRPGTASPACAITTGIRSCAVLSEPPKADRPGIGRRDAVADLDDDKAGKRADGRHRCDSPDPALLPAIVADRGPRDRPRPRSEAARTWHADGSDGPDFAALLRGRSLCS